MTVLCGKMESKKTTDIVYQIRSDYTVYADTERKEDNEKYQTFSLKYGIFVQAFLESREKHVFLYCGTGDLGHGAALRTAHNAQVHPR